MTFGANCQINTTVNGSAIATEQLSSVDYNGVTFTFDKPMPVGVFVTGEPFVVADQAFSITAISPASADINGNSHVGHGAMKNPYIAPGVSQGFDQYLSDGTGGVAAANTPYSAALNIDPAINGNIAIAQGEKASIVKTVRLVSVTDSDQWQTIEKYVILTVLDVVPPVGTVRPGIAGTTKTIRGRSDVDFTPSGITFLVGQPSFASLLADVPSFLGVLGTGLEPLRRFRLDAALGTTTSNYSQQIVAAHALPIIALNDPSEGTASERQDLIDKILTFANDLESLIDAGYTPDVGRGGGAGQGGAQWLWIMAAAALTKDAALLAKVDGVAFQPVGNGFWVSDADIGIKAPGKSGVAAQTYFTEMLNMPHIEPDEPGSHLAARYLHIAAQIVAWEQVAILAFNQGPTGRATGEAMILNGANDTTNQRAAAYNFLSRWKTWLPTTNSAHGTATDWIDIWNELVAQGLATEWAGAPDQPPHGDASALNDDYFSAGDGQITLSVPAGFDYATEVVTQRDFRYSLDGVQWIEEPNIGGLPYTKTGLLKGATHWCSWRLQSASGASPWSGNYPLATPVDSGSTREVRTLTGTATAAAPVNTVAPAIQQRIYPQWDFATYEPVAGVLTLNDPLILAAGIGYWSGYPAPTYSFQWKRGGVNISGATSQLYTRAATDAGAVLSCDVTATNSQGGNTVTTAGVTCPALTALPAGTLFDSDFQYAYAVDYETEIAGITTENAIYSHIPDFTHPLISTRGAIDVLNTVVRPSIAHPLQVQATQGQAYRVQAELMILGSMFGGSAEFYIETLGTTSPSAGTALLYRSQSQTIDFVDEVWTVDATFVPGAGQQDLQFRIRANSGSGSTSGPVLLALNISEV